MISRIVAGIILIVGIPLFVLIATLVWLQDGKNPFFTQIRLGKDQKIFRIYKFRTMYVGSDKDKVVCRSNDPRITKIGKWLRRSHLDEIPQLVNIILGDMRFVGPRPLRVLNSGSNNFALRHSVLPGLTGLDQVYGRKYVRHRVRFDQITIRNRNSVPFRLWIIARTMIHMIKLNGV